jgi:hypothetical protein
VPIGTALLDRVVLGNQLSLVSAAGMLAILAGLAMMVFNHPGRRPTS